MTPRALSTILTRLVLLVIIGSFLPQLLELGESPVRILFCSFSQKIQWIKSVCGCWGTIVKLWTEQWLGRRGSWGLTSWQGHSEPDFRHWRVEQWSSLVCSICSQQHINSMHCNIVPMIGPYLRHSVYIGWVEYLEVIYVLYMCRSLYRVKCISFYPNFVWCAH